MHERASHGEPLPPAARKQTGAPVEIRLEMGDRDQFVATLLQFLSAQTVKLAGKGKVLTHRQLVVERKFLRHVADHFFDGFALAADIVTADPGGAFRRLQNAAEHSDDGGLAGTIRSEKSEDGAARDRKADVIDGGEMAEAFRQPVALDHQIRHRRGESGKQEMRKVQALTSCSSFLFSCFPDSFSNVGKENIGGHSGAEFVLTVLQADLDSENLFDPVFHRLDVARSKFRLAIDLLDRAGKILVAK